MQPYSELQAHIMGHYQVRALEQSLCLVQATVFGKHILEAILHADMKKQYIARMTSVVLSVVSPLLEVTSHESSGTSIQKKGLDSFDSPPSQGTIT